MNVEPYNRPWFLINGHFETIWPSLFRQVLPPAYQRQRISTPDNDFLDLDWLQSGHKRLVVISHGLEGDSTRHYVAGMAHEMSRAGWDVLAWNFRGCSGEINRQPRITHNGSTNDLHCVVTHALAGNSYETVVLVGFSMGGNLSLVYLGREANTVPAQIKAAVCFSVPCDLAAASERLAEPRNVIYMKRFLRLMGHKVRQQAVNYPEQFSCANYSSLKTFHDFDNRYTAPLHGFRDARHYWIESSCLRYLSGIRVPAWIINAKNDPFLTPSCFPQPEIHGNQNVSLLAPEHGGHCGFARFGQGQSYWSETTAVSLLAGY